MAQVSVQVQQQKQTSLLGQSPENLWTCFKFANFLLSRTPASSPCSHTLLYMCHSGRQDYGGVFFIAILPPVSFFCILV